MRSYARVCRQLVPEILCADAAFERCTFNQSMTAWNAWQREQLGEPMPPPDTPQGFVSLDEVDGLEADQPTPLPHCVQIYLVSAVDQ